MSRKWNRVRCAGRMGMCCLLIGTVGCATRFPEYPEKTVESCVRQGQTPAVRVGADPITDSENSSRYFDMNLANARQLAVHVVIENRSPDQTLLVSREQFEIAGTSERDERGLRSDQRAGDAIATAGAVGLVVAPVVALPVLLVGAGISIDAHNVRANIANKALQQRTLAPGQLSRGFVFFQLPKDAPENPPNWMLRFAPRAVGGTSLDVVQIELLPGKAYP